MSVNNEIDETDVDNVKIERYLNVLILTHLLTVDVQVHFNS